MSQYINREKSFPHNFKLKTTIETVERAIEA